MSTKDYLSQIFLIERQVCVREEQLQDLRDKRENVASKLSLAKVMSSGRKDSVAEITALIVDLEDRYIADIVRLLRLKYDIGMVLDRLRSPVQKLIMEERYINLKGWEQIAEDNHYSLRMVHNHHVKALGALDADAKDCIELHTKVVV